MDESAFLRRFTDISFYRAHFMDADLWAPSVRRVCQRHGFDSRNISPGLAGTYPTFTAEVGVIGAQKAPGFIVVKFFGSAFNGLEAYQVECSLGTWLQQFPLPIPSPLILADGTLEPGWKYLVFEYVPGTSVGKAREQLALDEWVHLASQMGEYMHALHTRAIPDWPHLSGPLLPKWDGFNSFLRQRYHNCLSNHQAWNDLPRHLLCQLEHFLLPVEQLVNFSRPPHLIHADLTADHMLGRVVGSRWQTMAIIDWGDAMTGDILYELLALHFDFFRGDVQLLRHCLVTYDLPDFYRKDFPRKALCMALLYPYPLPDFVIAPHRQVRTLHELAECVFGL